MTLVLFFAPEILDIKPEDLREKFMAGVANLASVCLAIGYPTVASAPHSIVNGFKNLLAVAAVTEVDFPEAATIKEYIKVRFFLLRRTCNSDGFRRFICDDNTTRLKVLRIGVSASNSRTH